MRIAPRTRSLTLIALFTFATIMSAGLLSGDISRVETADQQTASQEPSMDQLRNGFPSLTDGMAVTYSPDQWPGSPLGKAASAAIYEVERKGNRLKAANPANRLNAEFDEAGFRLEQAVANPKWRTDWRLKSIGYGDVQKEVRPGKVTERGQRVEISRADPNLVEWFENRPEGLEHGFTLTERPAVGVNDGAPLRLVMELSGDLTATADSSGQRLTLSDRDGRRVLGYEKLVVWDADNRTQTARMSVSDGDVYLEVEESKARYPLTIDPLFTETQKITASDGNSGDEFGIKVAISGDTAIVSAYTDNGNTGSAYVFVRIGETWTEQQKLTASDGVAGDFFGTSVAISGDTAIVGAYGVDDNGSNSGAAYIFVRSGTTWAEQAKLTASDAAGGDAFGTSVAISADTAVVGAYTDDTGNGGDSGSAYIFVRSGTVWTEQQQIVPANSAGGDLLGYSVAILGDTMALGGYGVDAGASNSGGAYVFVRSGTVWTQQQMLSASDAGTNDYFGWSAEFSGETLVIGAPQDDANAGSAYVFVRSGTTWTEEQKLTASDGTSGDRFGTSVSVSGDRVIAGAYGSTAYTGAGYVYSRNGTAWTEQMKLVSSAGDPDDRFGISVGLSGSNALVGAYWDDDNGSNAGAVYVVPTQPVLTVTKTADTNDGLCDSDCSLREAITAANATSTEDIIEFASPLFDTPQTITLTSGRILIEINKDLTIEGPGADKLTISGGNISGLFNVSTGADVKFNGLTIADGNALYGSGIYNNAGGFVTLNDSVVRNNTQVGSGAGTGAAGIFNDNGTLTLNNSTVRDNVSNVTGGGIINKQGSVTINNSTISGNNSTNGGGGGIYSNSGSLTLNNTTVSGNSAQFSGGGIFIDSGATGTVTLSNSTITNNSGNDSGGMVTFRGSNFPVVANTIIAGNTAPTNPDVSGSFNSSGYNLIGKTDGGSGFGVTGDQTGTIAAPLIPALGPLQNNGGQTLTHILLSGSAAINGGSNALIPANITTDQRGAGFPRIVNTTVDIGAVEITTLDQTITFGPLADKNFGDAPFDVSATASSGLPVSFSASGDCSISGATVTLNGVGSCTITASQAGDGTYNAAPDVAQNFTINKANQTITFGGLADRTYGDSAFDVSATASSGLPVSFSAVGLCAVSGTTVTLTGAGDCTITASQAGNATYNAASDVSQTFTINKAALTVTADDRSIAFGDPDPVFTFAYSGFVNGETASFIDTAPSCSVSGLHTDPGNYPIDCSGGADNNYDFAYVAGNLNVDSPFITETQKLLPISGVSANQHAGSAVAISGDTAVVGAPQTGTGRVWVFVKTQSGWEQQQMLLPSDGDARGDKFGSGVAIEGDTLVVGAWHKYSPEVSPYAWNGAMYIFERTNGVWTETFTVRGPGSSYFGRDVAISNGTVIIGALGANSAFVYAKENGTWTEQAHLTSPDSTGADNFGADVDISGDTAIVGSYLADVNGVNDQGAAYVYVRNGTTWGFEQKLTDTSDPGANYYGWNVAVDDDTAAVGTPQDDIDGRANQGSAYVYVRNGTTWTEQKKLTAVDGFANDQFGGSVDLDGNGLIVGAYLDDVASGDQGSAYVFKRDSGNWDLQDKLLASDSGGSHQFGFSSAIEGNTVAVGSPFNSNVAFKAGVGYIFAADILDATTLSVSPAVGTFAGTTTLSATLTKTADSSVLSGKTINFTLNGTAAGSAVTDASGVATVSGVSLSGISAGSYPIAVGASFAGDIDFEASSGSNSLTVDPAGQTITFGGLADRTYGDAPFDVAATATSGLPVSFAAGGTCSVSGSTVTIAGVGNCTITASQAGDTNYSAASNVDQSFTINKAILTVTGDNKSITSGDPDPNFTFAYDGFVNGDGAGDIDTAPTCAVNVVHVDPGNYPIQCSGGADNNYDFTYVDGNLNVNLPFINETQKIVPNGPFNISQHYGTSVAISGNTAIVGAPQTGTGRAWVFTKTASGWEQEEQLLPSDGDPRGDKFGGAVAIEGDTIVVGAWHKYSPVGSIWWYGAIYIFEKINGTWQETHKILGPGTSSYGTEVAISNGTVIVGSGGSAFVYAKENGTWTEQGHLTSPDPTGNDGFGLDVDISGDTAIVGANLADVDGVIDQGAAYVFVRNATTWEFQQKLTDTSDPGVNGYGFGVAIDGDTAVVGAPRDDVGGNADQGSTYVYVRSGTTWTEQEKLTAGDGFTNDQFGSSVAVDGNGLVVGAFWDDVASGVDQGSAYVYKRNSATGVWDRQEKLHSSDGNGSDQFGFSVILEGNSAIVGAPFGLGAFYYDLNILDATTLSVSPAVGTFGGTTILSATLTKTSDSSVLGGKTIEFTFNGTVAGSAVTDASGVATVSGVSLSGVNAGSYPTAVGASFAGDIDLEASSGSNSLTVDPAGQTITFGGLADKTYGDAAFDVAATATSGLPVSFSASGDCTISGTTVTLTGVGNCTVTASQAGDGNYNPAADVQQTFAINSPSNQTFTVTKTADTNDGVCDADCSLREAIAAANAAVSDDTIEFASPLFDTPQTITLTMGEFLINYDKNLTIEGPAANKVRISGNGTTRVFNINSGGDVKFNRVVIVDGNSTTGSGIYLNQNSTATLNNTSVGGNSSSGDGAGIFNDNGTLTLIDSTVSGNIASPGNGSSGGGIFNQGGTVTLVNSTIGRQNFGDTGAGIFNSGVMTITNSTICHNSSLNGGAGIWNEGTLTLTNATICTNSISTFTAGKGIHNTGTVSIANTIVAGGSPVTAPDVAGSTFNSLGHNLIGNADGGTGFGASGDLIGTAISPLDPKLGLLQDNGGPTGTRSLLGGSPAIDAGSNALIPAGVTTDQRGAGFDRIFNSTVDIGAVEITTIDQTITFGSLPVKTYGDAPFNVTATASSGLPVSFAAAGVCSVSGNTVTINGAGNCTITASQGGDSLYNPAPNVAQILTINKADQTITFGALTTRVFGESFDSTATASSGLTVGFQVLSGPATVSADTVTTTGTGSVTVRAVQSGDANYNAASPVDRTFAVNKANTTISMSNVTAASGPATLSFQAQVTAKSPSQATVDQGSVVFTVTQGSPATVVGSPVTVPVSPTGLASTSFSLSTDGAYQVFASYSSPGNFNSSNALATATVGGVNPVPGISAVGPTATQAAGTDFTLTVSGSNFAADSVVRWNGLDKPTTYVSPTQLTATIGGADILVESTATVTVFNPGPGGGSSNPQAFFVTNTNTTVTGVTSATGDPTSGTATASISTSPGGTVTATADTSGATGSGGTLTLAEYGSDPVGVTTTFSSTGSFFDVQVSPDSTFQTLTLDYCNSGGSLLYWWNGSDWIPVSDQSYDATTDCIGVTIDATTSPSIAQLTGTVFAVATGPKIGLITADPAVPVPLGAGVSLSTGFTDLTDQGPYDVDIYWGDDPTPQTFEVQSPGAINADHTYSSTGVYTVRVKVTDSNGLFGVSTYPEYVVVYDPADGFVTGGGWIDSPIGAYTANPALTGKATFGFSAKYKNGANVPTGQTQFNFRVGRLNFHSTSYEWLVIAGAKAKYKGLGTINGEGSFKFMLTAIDGDKQGNGNPDKFRIRIWDSVTNEVIYDNQISDPEDSDPSTVLGGGSIMIKK